MVQLRAIRDAFLVVLAYPANMIKGLIGILNREYSYILTVAASDKPVTLAVVWGLVKWSFVALLLFLVVAYVVFDTARRVFASERMAKKSLLIDLAMIGLTLFVYYFLIAIGLFVFLKIIVPVARVL